MGAVKFRVCIGRVLGPCSGPIEDLLNMLSQAHYGHRETSGGHNKNYVMYACFIFIIKSHIFSNSHFF